MPHKFNNIFQKRFGGNHKIADVSVNLGATKGRGSSTRINNYLNETNGLGTGIYQFIVVKK